MRTEVAAALAGLALLLAACGSSAKTEEPIGQLFDRAGSGAGIVPLGSVIETSLSDPRNSIVIVYNHGTDWGGKFQDCEPSTMPDFLKRWADDGVGGFDVVIFYLCAQVAEDWFVMGKARSEENERALDRLLAAGVPPAHIFVFGHSGGASTALLTAERAPRKFNSAVVSAPGYGFAYLDAEGEDYLWMDSEYDKWRSRLANADDMSALVFLFEGDIWAPPGDATFLALHPKVEVVRIRDEDDDGMLCSDEPEPHFYWWSRCFKETEVERVETFVLERLEQRAWLP